ncbi:MAG: hypothetical protein ACLUR5_10815 [Eubacterium ventriosum]
MDGFLRQHPAQSHKTMKESFMDQQRIPNQKIVAPANDGIETTVKHQVILIQLH